MNQNNAVAKAEEKQFKHTDLITSGQRGLMPQSFGDIQRICIAYHKSSAGKASLEDIVLCVTKGMELGLGTATSFESVAVINGRTSIYGDAIPGLVRARSKDLEYMHSEFDVKDGSDEYAAIFHVKRKSETKEHEEIYSVKDARRAGLWGKTGAWTTDPKGMLRRRAMNRGLRFKFPEVLQGILSFEEAHDIPPEKARNITPTEEGEVTAASMNADLNPEPQEAEIVEPEIYEDSIAEDDAKAKQPEPEPILLSEDLDEMTAKQDKEAEAKT